MYQVCADINGVELNTVPLNEDFTFNSQALEDAIALAAIAHAGQKDKVGLPVICHSMRVMLTCTNPKQMTVGILHDVVEDTDITLDDLRKYGYSEDVVQAIDAISKRNGESFEQYIERCSKNQLSVGVKRIDISDNLSPFRHMGLNVDHRIKLRTKYKKAIKFLDEVVYE